MVIFHSYVKLPEGKSLRKKTWWFLFHAETLLSEHVPRPRTNAQHPGHESRGWAAWRSQHPTKSVEKEKTQRKSGINHELTIDFHRCFFL